LVFCIAVGFGLAAAFFKYVFNSVKKLKNIGNRTTIFGGFSVIFSGDFRQLKPVCSNERELLF
jgi:hypothetical protein